MSDDDRDIDAYVASLMREQSRIEKKYENDSISPSWLDSEQNELENNLSIRSLDEMDEKIQLSTLKRESSNPKQSFWNRYIHSSYYKYQLTGLVLISMLCYAFYTQSFQGSQYFSSDNQLSNLKNYENIRNQYALNTFDQSIDYPYKQYVISKWPMTKETGNTEDDALYHWSESIRTWLQKTMDSNVNTWFDVRAILSNQHYADYLPAENLINLKRANPTMCQFVYGEKGGWYVDLLDYYENQTEDNKSMINQFVKWWFNVIYTYIRSFIRHQPYEKFYDYNNECFYAQPIDGQAEKVQLYNDAKRERLRYDTTLATGSHVLHLANRAIKVRYAWSFYPTDSVWFKQYDQFESFMIETLKNDKNLPYINAALDLLSQSNNQMPMKIMEYIQKLPMQEMKMEMMYNNLDLARLRAYRDDWLRLVKFATLLWDKDQKFALGMPMDVCQNDITCGTGIQSHCCRQNIGLMPLNLWTREWKADICKSPAIPCYPCAEGLTAIPIGTVGSHPPSNQVLLENIQAYNNMVRLNSDLDENYLYDTKMVTRELNEVMTTMISDNKYKTPQMFMAYVCSANLTKFTEWVIEDTKFNLNDLSKWTGIDFQAYYKKYYQKKIDSKITTGSSQHNTQILQQQTIQNPSSYTREQVYIQKTQTNSNTINQNSNVIRNDVVNGNVRDRAGETMDRLKQTQFISMGGLDSNSLAASAHEERFCKQSAGALRFDVKTQSCVCKLGWTSRYCNLPVGTCQSRLIQKPCLDDPTKMCASCDGMLRTNPTTDYAFKNITTSLRECNNSDYPNPYVFIEYRKDVAMLYPITSTQASLKNNLNTRRTNDNMMVVNQPMCSCQCCFMSKGNYYCGGKIV